MRAFQAAGLGLFCCSLGFAPPAAGQGTAFSQDRETSIRAAGMGGASVAVTWGEPAPWGNPALLAETRGIAWLAGSTKVIPEISEDITFKSSRFLIGGEGIGFSIMGEPISGLGETRLSYGFSEGTDPGGNPTGSFESYEEIEGWGVGVSPLQLLDAFRLNRDHDASRFSQRADVSFGYQHKSTEISQVAGSSARAENFDWGVQARVAILPGDHEGREPRLELGGGYAMLNADENSLFDFGPTAGTAPSTQIQRTGFALHASLPLSQSGDEGAGPWGWWFATVPRALDVGLAYDREALSAGGGADRDVERVGFEATLMGILAGRLGHVDDPYNNISGMTYGVGVHLPLGPWASLGYDWASVPVASDSGLDPLGRHGFAAWLHPIVLWRSTRE